MKFGVCVCVLKDYMFCYAKITVKNNIQFSCIGHMAAATKVALPRVRPTASAKV